MKQQKFINKAKEVHNNKYDYSKVNYKNNRTNVIIICKEHGEFEQTPGNHTNKTKPKGCSSCGKLKLSLQNLISLPKIKVKINKLWGDRFLYPYINNEYKNMSSKITIICKEHGEFKQDMLHHITRKQKCNKCSLEESKNKQLGRSKPGGNLVNYYTLNEEKGKRVGSLYSIKIYNENEIFYKVGITSQTLKNRLCRIPYDYEILEVIKLPNIQTAIIENIIHKNNKNKQYIPNKKFNGYTECYNESINLYEYILTL